MQPVLDATDERFLERALELARGAAAFASPNPAVGCVLARGLECLGEGGHRYDRRDHAEIVALRSAAQAEKSVQGATAYVTLEPCAHHGRTPPCAAALVAAGIGRCVVATHDPNPLVAGKGLETMRSAGIDVIVADPSSAIAQRARRLNDAFAFSIGQGRPFVTLKAAVSVDGMLAPPPASRSRTAAPFWLTGEAARADVQELRHATDAILTGIGTVLADDPLLSDRTGRPRRLPLLRVVLDSRLRLPVASRLVQSADEDLLAVAGEDAPAAAEARLRERGVEVLRVPRSTADAPVLEVRPMLERLQMRGVRSLLLEGGAAVHGHFLSAGLVDRLVLYFADVELGAGAVPFAAGQPSVYAWQQRLTAVERVAFPRAGEPGREDIRVSGYLHDPWSREKD